MNTSRASSKSSGVHSITSAQQNRAKEIMAQRSALRDRSDSKPQSMRFGRALDSNTPSLANTATAATAQGCSGVAASSSPGCVASASSHQPRSTSRPTGVASAAGGGGTASPHVSSTSRVFCSRSAPPSSRPVSARSSPMSAMFPASACSSPCIDRSAAVLIYAPTTPASKNGGEQQRLKSREASKSVCLSPPVDVRSPSSLRKVAADTFDASDVVRPSTGMFPLPRPTGRRTAGAITPVRGDAPVGGFTGGDAPVNLEAALVQVEGDTASFPLSASRASGLTVLSPLRSVADALSGGTLSAASSMFLQPRPTPRSSAIVAELMALAAASGDGEERGFAASSMLHAPVLSPTAVATGRKSTAQQQSPGGSAQKAKVSGDSTTMANVLGRTSFALSDVIVSPCSDVAIARASVAVSAAAAAAAAAAEVDSQRLSFADEAERILDLNDDDDDAATEVADASGPATALSPAPDATSAWMQQAMAASSTAQPEEVAAPSAAILHPSQTLFANDFSLSPRMPLAADDVECEQPPHDVAAARDAAVSQQDSSSQGCDGDDGAVPSSESVCPPSEAFFECVSTFASPILVAPTPLVSLPPRLPSTPSSSSSLTVSVVGKQSLAAQFAELQALASHVMLRPAGSLSHGCMAPCGGSPAAATVASSVASQPTPTRGKCVEKGRVPEARDDDDEDAAASVSDAEFGSPDRRTSSRQRLIDSAGSTPHPHTPAVASRGSSVNGKKGGSQRPGDVPRSNTLFARSVAASREAEQPQQQSSAPPSRNSRSFPMKRSRSLSSCAATTLLLTKHQQQLLLLQASELPAASSSTVGLAPLSPVNTSGHADEQQHSSEQLLVAATAALPSSAAVILPAAVASSAQLRRPSTRKSELQKLLEACPDSIRDEISPKAFHPPPQKESRRLDDDEEAIVPAAEAEAPRVSARPRAFVCDYTFWEKDLVARTTKASRRLSGRPSAPTAASAVAPLAAGARKVPPVSAPAVPLEDPALDASSRQRPAKKGRIERKPNTFAKKR